MKRRLIAYVLLAGLSFGAVAGTASAADARDTGWDCAPGLC